MHVIKILLLLLIGIESYLLQTGFHNIHKINRPIGILAVEKDTNDTFPSFYKFLENRKKQEEKQVLEYFKKAEEKEKRINKMERYKYINPRSKDLSLINNIRTIELSKKWISDMVNYENYFPPFMYQDMYSIRDFAKENITKQYFYIAYIPLKIRRDKEPYYIGAFELIPESREFRTHLIIQNPNYFIENQDDYHRIINFKKELIKMTEDALVFLRFGNLQNKSNNRYYMSWLLEDDD